MAYLMAQSKRQGKRSFTIPYDRQGLADFLGVDRSALSAEISKLRKEGVLESRGSHFSLRPSPDDSTN
jgi:CRP-like cAMP-binding protein